MPWTSGTGGLCLIGGKLVLLLEIRLVLAFWYHLVIFHLVMIAHIESCAFAHTAHWHGLLSVLKKHLCPEPSLV